MSRPTAAPTPARWDMRIRSLLEFSKYFVVSAAALLLDMGLLILLVEVAHWHYLLSATISFLAGSWMAFIGSSRFVFAEHTYQSDAGGFTKFTIIGLIGLVINLAVLSLSVQAINLDYRTGKIIAAGFSFLFNFLVRKIILFSHHVRRTDL